jgi:hypothetical protein
VCFTCIVILDRMLILEEPKVHPPNEVGGAFFSFHDKAHENRSGAYIPIRSLLDKCSLVFTKKPMKTGQIGL